MKPGGCDDGEGIKCNRPRYYLFSLSYSSYCLDNNNIIFLSYSAWPRRVVACIIFQLSQFLRKRSSFFNLHLCSAVPWGRCLPAPCHSTQTLSHPCTCIVHLACGFRHRLLSLPLKCLISSHCVKALSQCGLHSGSSLIGFWDNISMSSTTSLFAESYIALHVFLHTQFIFDWFCAVHVIQFLPYVFVIHRG